MFLLNNTKLPEVEEAPEALDYILKHNFLSNYGAAYTASNLDNESWKELMYLQICLNSESRAVEMQQKRSQYVQKEDFHGN